MCELLFLLYLCSDPRKCSGEPDMGEELLEPERWLGEFLLDWNPRNWVGWNCTRVWECGDVSIEGGCSTPLSENVRES